MDDLVTVPPTPAAAPADRFAYSISEAAGLLGVSRVTIWRWIRAGRLPVTRLGHRTTRIRRDDLECLLLERVMAQVGSADAGSWVAGTLNVDMTGGHDAGNGYEPRAGDHAVQFYETDDYLLDALAAFIGPALQADEACIVIATPAHCAGLEQRLRAAGVDGDAARTSGRYLVLDAADTLSRFMVAGMPDPGRFLTVVGGVVAQAATAGRRVRAFGEMVALLALDGHRIAAARLEALWNDLHQRYAFSLVCAYPMNRLNGSADAQLIRDVSATHTRVVPAESYTALPSPDTRLRAIAALQQKAAWLEAEIAERGRVEAELQQREEVQQRLAAIVESSEDAIIGKTLDALITSWNASAERMFGYTAEEMIGQPILRLIPPERHHEEDHILARLRAGERVEHFDTVRLTKDGRRLDVSLTISPVRDSAGAIIGASKIARDITAQKQAAAEREALLAREQMALADVQAALRVRDDFLGAISHDLRTPLSSIKGLTQLLLRQANRGSTLDVARLIPMLTTIDTATHRMTTMIDELLDLTRLNAGHALELDRQPADLVALIQASVAECQRTSREHRVVIDTAVPALHGHWDAARLDRVVANLLSNAVKYSPDGGAITVTLIAEEVDSGTWATLTVQDEGVGIPAADLPHIFDRFHRGANVAGQIRGVGIGLSGCKQIVELHGGTVAITSEEGAGTTVTVRLPCAADEASEIPQT